MNVLIINHNGGSPYHGPNLRTYYAAKELVGYGHRVFITSSSYSHKYSVLPEVEGAITHENIDGIQYKWVKCLKYKNLLQRIYSHFEFGFKLLIHRRKICTAPDLIIFSGPPPEIFLFSWILSKILNSPIVSDVRDLWPRTQIEMNKWQWLNPYTYFLFFSQYMMFRLSEILISPLPGAKKYIDGIVRDKKIEIIENGYDLSGEQKKGEVSLKIVHGYEFFGLKQPEYISTSKIESLGCFVVGYSGAFDRDNDVESLILAAKKINNKSEVVFLLVGAGIKVNDYIRMADGNANIIICDRIPSKDVPSVLNKMDVCYCGLKPKSIYQYGVSLAKSYEYMAAAKPIIWMVEACNNPVRNSGGGLTLSPGNADELSQAIINLLRMDKNKLAEMGAKNYQYLLEKHSYQVLGRKWDKLVSRFK